MSIGSTILSLMGTKDPRQALLESIAGGGGASGAQYADPAAGGAGTTAPAGTVPAGAPQPAPRPTGFDSPPDLSALYGDLLKYQGKATNIDRGFGLIGSSISQDGNRDSTLKAFTGDGSGVAIPDPASIATMGMEMQKAALSRQSRAAMMANLPAIAKRYGLDLETARLLYEQGKLEDVISEKEKPNLETVTDANGQTLLIDKNTATQQGVFGTEKDQSDVIDGPNGTKLRYDPVTQSVTPITGPDTMTADTREYDRYVADEKMRNNQSPLSFQEWRLTKPASVKVENNLGDKADPQKKRFAEKSGDFFAEDYQNLRKARNSGRDMLGQYALAEKALDNNVNTGAFGEYEQSLRKIGASLGIDTDMEKVTGGELLKTVTNRMALLMRNPESGMGMPGSVSDRDLTFLKDAQVGLTTQNPRAMIDVFRRIEKRKIDIANLADDYVKKNGNLDAGFDAVVSDFVDKNSMFEGINLKGNDPEAYRKSVYEQYRSK